MKKIIKQIKKLTNGWATLNIGEDTFREVIVLSEIGYNKTYIYAISSIGVGICIEGELSEKVYSVLSFEALSIEVLREVLENVKEAQSFL